METDRIKNDRTAYLCWMIVYAVMGLTGGIFTIYPLPPITSLTGSLLVMLALLLGGIERFLYLFSKQLKEAKRVKDKKEP